MTEIAVSETVSLAYQEKKITLNQIIEVARIDPKYQDDILDKVIDKGESKTRKIVDDYLSKQFNPSKKNSNLLKIRGSELSEIRIDSHALQYRMIAENLLGIIPQVNYLINECLCTPDWTVDERTKYSLIVKIGSLKLKCDKLITFINSCDTNEK